MKILFKVLTILLCAITLTFASNDQCVALKRSTNPNATSDTQLAYAFNLAKSQKKPCVFLPAGEWNFKSMINVPAGITLVGNYDNIHNSTANNIKHGTTINCRVGLGLDSAHTAYGCILLGQNTGLNGLNVVWPEQRARNKEYAIQPNTYPFGVICNGTCKIEHVTIANAYNGLMLNGDNNKINNLNIGAYKRAIVINSTGNFGELYSGNIHDMFITSYNNWSIADDTDWTKLNPYIDKLENEYLYYNMVGIQINNSTGGTINGFFVFKSLNGYRINTNPTREASTVNTPIYIVNSGCDLCNYSMNVESQKPYSELHFDNGQLFGKINVASDHNGTIMIYNTPMHYYVTKFEKGNIPHIMLGSPNTKFYATNSDITTAGCILQNVHIPFSSTVIWTAGQVILRNVNIINPHLYTEGWKSSVWLVEKFAEWLTEEYMSVTEDMKHLLTHGDKANIMYINGYILGYDALRPIQYINGKAYTDGSKITNISVINVHPRGQWTSSHVEEACETYMGSLGFLCPSDLNDPEYRYKPKIDEEML